MVETIHKKKIQQCFYVTIILKVFEIKIKEYPTLAPVKNELSTISSLRYKQRESPYSHVKEVPKNVGKQGRVQSLVETFTRQATRWWDTHQSRLQTWTTTST